MLSRRGLDEKRFWPLFKGPILPEDSGVAQYAAGTFLPVFHPGTGYWGFFKNISVSNRSVEWTSNFFLPLSLLIVTRAVFRPVAS